VDVNLDGPFPNEGRFRTVRLLADEEFARRFRPRVVSQRWRLCGSRPAERAAYVADGDLSDSVHFTSGIALCNAADCVVTDIQGRPVDSGVGGMSRQQTMRPTRV
jgi:myo-inositol-1(or 4)-monophosphatase